MSFMKKYYRITKKTDEQNNYLTEIYQIKIGEFFVVLPALQQPAAHVRKHLSLFEINPNPTLCNLT